MCELHTAQPGCKDSLDEDQKSDCTVYIDEAGDLGIGRGTRWFILIEVNGWGIRTHGHNVELQKY